MAEFGAAWFGGLETLGLAPDLFARATNSPAIYGLHATLKAPFRPREDVRRPRLFKMRLISSAPEGGRRLEDVSLSAAISATSP